MADPDQGPASAFIEDSVGQIWFGVQDARGGLYRLARSRVSAIGQPEGLPCNNIGGVTQAADGTIWIGLFCGNGKGLVAIRNGSMTFHPGPTWVQSLLTESDGTVWAGMVDGGLFRVDRGRFVEVASPTRERQDEIAVLYRHPSGALWLGTNHGVAILHDGRWTRLRVSDGLLSDDVHSIVGDRNGATWIGTDIGISLYHDGRFTSYGAEDGVPPGHVRAMHVDADGVVWIGTYGGGLARLKDGKITAYGVRGGILDSSVHRILEDEHGFLWLTGDRGIRRASKRDLNAVADGREVAVEVTLYTEADGMRSIECNGMARPAGWRMQDGTFYFPTQRGMVHIDPARALTVPPVPVPHIDGASVDGQSSPVAQEVLVPAGYRDVELRFTAPALARPELVQFKYRLEGYNADWIEIGTRRVASFVNLRPGAYRFLVTARNSGGAWSEQPAVLVLVLQPYFYQRVPFQISLALLVIVGTVAVGRWYLEGLRRRAEDLEQAVAARTTDLSVAHRSLATAKEQVEQAHGQVLAVLSQLDIGVLILNAAGVVQYASPSAQQMLGKSADALMGRPWSACLPLPETDRAQLKSRIVAPSSVGARFPVQIVLGGKRYWMEIDVRDQPPPGDGRILYIYNVTEMSALPANEQPEGAYGLVGRSTVMHLVYKQIRDVARVDATVLIEGETGVGKELVARAIHHGSRRASKPFVAVNAAGLSESLLASQLFGHRRGAFTGAVDDQIGVFEAANGGTLFLDELGDMPPSVQASLLRVLQEREITRLGDSQARRVDVRFLAATHRDLTREVEGGRFREDLLYRIRVATIAVPPLRERIEDVPLLVDTFLAQAARAPGRPAPQMSRDALNALVRYAWPGSPRAQSHHRARARAGDG